MIRDLRTILDGWEYEPGKISVRKIVGRDGQEKIQTRIDLGVLQIELDGRPDGTRPDGYESVLEQLEAQLAQHVELYGDDDDFVLTSEDCSDLRHEAYLYYQRYLSLFVLEDFERVIRDTARNLRVIEMCEQYGAAETDRHALDRQRCYVLMMNARAKGCLALEQDRHDEALGAVDAGLSAIEALTPEQIDEDDDPDPNATELRVLTNLRKQIVEAMPDEAPLKLRTALDAALEREDYEAAARLRDQLAELSTD